MAFYRNISMSFWTDSKVDDDFTPEDKYFFLYLMTNPHTNICGCYEISMKQMERETGYNTDTVKRLLHRMEKMHNVIRYSEKTKEVLIVNWGKYNWSASEKVKKAVIAVADHIKHEQFRRYVMDMVSISYTYDMLPSITDTVSETETEYRIQNTERVCDAHAPEQQNFQKSFQHIENHPNIRLTVEQFSELKSLDYSKTKKPLEAYLAILDERIASGRKYKDHFLTLRKWAMQDGAVPSTNNHSYDLDEIQRLIDEF